MSVAEEIKQFYYDTVQNTKDLEQKVSQFKQIAESTKYSQEELEKTFKGLQETASTLQSAYEAKKTVLNLMKR